MATKKLTVYDRIYQHLFDDKDKTPLNDNDYRVKARIQAGFTKKLDLPTITDRQLVRFLMETFDISQPQAYIDINAIETIYGNLRKANKDFIRLMVSETQKAVINIELKRIQEVEEHNSKIKDVGKKVHYSTQHLTAALSVLAKANNLDKEDPDMPNWEDVQPPIIEPTDDVTSVDLEAVPVGTIQRLKERYLGKLQQINQQND